MIEYPSSITICDVGLRDGLQNEKTILTTDQKISLLHGLIDAGFSVIEIGSFMSPKAVPQMADTDKLFLQIGHPKGVELRALIANIRGVERAVACGCKKVKLNVSASLQHNLKNLNCTPTESVAKFSECVLEAKKNGLEISGSISMPFSSPWEGRIPIDMVEDIIRAYLDVGVTEISLSDASGMAVPQQVTELCSVAVEKYPQVTWWLHFHNTRGLALSNIMAAMDVGITHFDSSFGGLGGCPFVPDAAGNISSEDLINLCNESNISTNIDILKVLDVSRELQGILNHDMNSYILKAGRNCDLLCP